METFKIAFFGSSKFVLPILKSILENQNKTLRNIFEENKNNKLFLNQQNLLPSSDLDKPVSLEVVVTSPVKYNRGKEILNPVFSFAKEKNIKIYAPQKINLEIEKATNVLKNIDLAIVASFGQIISQEILNLPSHGFINWHPSLLPKYRGPSPMQECLKNGDLETGLSWIEMSKEMDAGDVLLQIPERIEANIKFAELAKKMGDLGSLTWFFAALQKISGQKMFVQDNTKATFTKIIKKEDKFIDIQKQTAKGVFDHFRAYQLYPGTFLKDSVFGEIKLIDCEFIDFELSTAVKKGEWFQEKNKPFSVYLKCQGPTFLKVNKIRKQDGKELNFSGYRF